MPDTPKVLAGRYEIIAPLGRGGMGVVYRARDLRLDRVLAVKGIAALTDEDRVRFGREARVAAQLNHPHIVKIHDVELDGDECFLTMDLIEGKSLGDAPLGRREAVEVVRKIAEALHYAHEQGIVHRDVKPDNILLDGAGRPYLTDFGLARPVSGSKLTVSGMILGTPAYMSPEQARGLDVDRRSDVYSLGATLYHCLTGRPPFTGPEAIDVIHRLCTDDPPPPGKVAAAVHADLETIVLKCLEKDPKRRYATARELADDLGRWLAGEPILARPVTRTERVLRWISRHRAVSALSAALVLVLLVALFNAVAPGRLKVESEPPGARVKLDGVPIGTTPLVTPLLWPPGRRVLEFERDDCEPWAQTVEVRARETADARAALRRHQGWLRLTSAMGALEVRVWTPKGGYVMSTSAPSDRVPIETGRYVLQVSRPHYFGRSVEVEVRAGRETYEHLTLEPMMSWSYQLPGTKAYLLFLADLNRDGVRDVATQCSDANLHVLDGRTGDTLGKLPYLGSHPSATAIDADGDGWEDVVQIARDGSLTALSWEERRTLWTWRPPQSACQFVSRCGSVLAVAWGGNALSAIDSATGKERWKAEGPFWFAAPSGPNLLAVGLNGQVAALDAATGERRWSFAAGSRIRTLPALGRIDGDDVDDIVVGTDARIVFALSGKDGSVLRKIADAGPSATLADGTPVAAGPDLRLTSYGVPAWTGDATPEWGALLAADLDGDGRSEILSGRLGLAVFSPDGKLLARHLADEKVLRPPLAADLDGDGAPEIVAGTEEGRVTVLRTRPQGTMWLARAGTDGMSNGQPGSEARVADVDGDGRSEVAVVGESSVSLLEGDRGKARWSVERKRALASPVLVADADGDGVLDVVAAEAQNPYDGEVLAFSGRDGRVLWIRPGVRCGVYHLVAKDPGEGVLYSHGVRGEGQLVVFALKDGKTRWEVSVPAASAPRPCFLEESVVVHTGRELVAFSLPDGSVVWRQPLARRIDLALAAWDHDGDGKKGVAYVSYDGTVEVRDGQTGRAVWSVQTRQRHEVVPSAADVDADGVEELILGSSEGTFYVFSGKRAEPLWTARASGHFYYGGQAVHDFNGDGAPDLAVGNSDRWLRIYSGRDGKVLWQRDLGVPLSRLRPVVADLDRDGRPELLINTGDRLTRAITVDLSRIPPLPWTRADVRSPSPR